MKSILVKIIRTLIITSIPEVFCNNLIESRSDCKEQNRLVGDKLIFAHVVRIFTLNSVFIYSISFLILFLSVVLQIFRHGERNIDNTYPNDPFKDEIYWPGGFGALTNVSVLKE